MTNKVSVKIGEKGLEFLTRLRTNRRKIDSDDRDLPYWKLMEVITKYFKLNNDRYIELVKMEYGK